MSGVYNSVGPGTTVLTNPLSSDVGSVYDALEILFSAINMSRKTYLQSIFEIVIDAVAVVLAGLNQVVRA